MNNKFSFLNILLIFVVFFIILDVAIGKYLYKKFIRKNFTDINHSYRIKDDIFDHSFKKSLTNFISFNKAETLKQSLKIFLLYSLITLGIFSFFSLEINLPIIAAFLTILGYSLNDTIVVFDRIRENLNIDKNKDEISNIVNKSINQTLTRTLLTSLTTLIVLVILYFVGSYLIKLFTLALIIGVIIGTYSSIFIASYSVSILHNKFGYILEKFRLDDNEA